MSGLNREGRTYNNRLYHVLLATTSITFTCMTSNNDQIRRLFIGMIQYYSNCRHAQVHLGVVQLWRNPACINKLQEAIGLLILLDNLIVVVYLYVLINNRYSSCISFGIHWSLLNGMLEMHPLDIFENTICCQYFQASKCKRQASHDRAATSRDLAVI